MLKCFLWALIGAALGAGFVLYIVRRQIRAADKALEYALETMRQGGSVAISPLRPGQRPPPPPPPPPPRPRVGVCLCPECRVSAERWQQHCKRQREGGADNAAG
jgi:hypothetical protein